MIYSEISRINKFIAVNFFSFLKTKVFTFCRSWVAVLFLRTLWYFVNVTQAIWSLTDIDRRYIFLFSLALPLLLLFLFVLFLSSCFLLLNSFQLNFLWTLFYSIEPIGNREIYKVVESSTHYDKDWVHRNVYFSTKSLRFPNNSFSRRELPRIARHFL